MFLIPVIATFNIYGCTINMSQFTAGVKRFVGWRANISSTPPFSGRFRSPGHTRAHDTSSTPSTKTNLCTMNNGFCQSAKFKRTSVLYQSCLSNVWKASESPHQTLLSKSVYLPVVKTLLNTLIIVYYTHNTHAHNSIPCLAAITSIYADDNSIE